MSNVDIQKLRHECLRILAYLEDSQQGALRRDTPLGDAVFLRIQRLHDLAWAALDPKGADGSGEPASQAGLFIQIEPGEPEPARRPVRPAPAANPLQADLDQLKTELAQARATILELEAAQAQARPAQPSAEFEFTAAAPQPAPQAAAPHLKVVAPASPAPSTLPNDENMTFLGLARK